MFNSEQIWKAIDDLAMRNGLSTSRLSILSGLDPTALNRSKRASADGRPRWMSTETIAKILIATRTPPHEFFAMLSGPSETSAEGKRVVPRRRGGSAAQGHVLLVDPDRLSTDRPIAQQEPANRRVDESAVKSG